MFSSLQDPQTLQTYNKVFNQVVIGAEPTLSAQENNYFAEIVGNAQQILADYPVVLKVGNMCTQRNNAYNLQFLEQPASNAPTGLHIALVLPAFQAKQRITEPTKSEMLTRAVTWNGDGGARRLLEVLRHLQSLIYDQKWRECDVLVVLKREWAHWKRIEHVLNAATTWGPIARFLTEEFGTQAVLKPLTQTSYITEREEADGFREWITSVLARWLRVEALVTETSVVEHLWRRLMREFVWAREPLQLRMFDQSTTSKPVTFASLAKVAIFFGNDLRDFNLATRLRLTDNRAAQGGARLRGSGKGRRERSAPAHYRDVRVSDRRAPPQREEGPWWDGDRGRDWRQSERDHNRGRVRVEAPRQGFKRIFEPEPAGVHGERWRHEQPGRWYNNANSNYYLSPKQPRSDGQSWRGEATVGVPRQGPRQPTPPPYRQRYASPPPVGRASQATIGSNNYRRPLSFSRRGPYPTHYDDAGGERHSGRGQERGRQVGYGRGSEVLAQRQAPSRARVHVAWAEDLAGIDDPSGWEEGQPNEEEERWETPDDAVPWYDDCDDDRGSPLR